MVPVTKPLIDITWTVLESAVDAGITEVVTACRTAITARRLGRRIEEGTRNIILNAYEELRAFA